MQEARLAIRDSSGGIDFTRVKRKPLTVSRINDF